MNIYLFKIKIDNFLHSLNNVFHNKTDYSTKWYNPAAQVSIENRKATKEVLGSLCINTIKNWFYSTLFLNQKMVSYPISICTNSI